MAFFPHSIGSNEHLPSFSPEVVAEFVAHYDQFIGRAAVVQDGRLASLVRLESRATIGNDVYYRFTEISVCAITNWTGAQVMFSDERVNPDGILVSLHNSASQFFDCYWLVASTYATTHFLFNETVTGLFAAGDASWFIKYLPLRERFEHSLRQYQAMHGNAWFRESLFALRSGQHIA